MPFLQVMSYSRIHLLERNNDVLSLWGECRNVSPPLAILVLDKIRLYQKTRIYHPKYLSGKQKTLI